MLIYSQSLNKIFFLKRIPFIFILLLSCITSTFYAPLGYALNMPSVPIICIVFWCLRLGNLFNSFEIFILGALTDIIIGTPLGSYSLLYLIISSISNYFKHKFSHSNIISHFFISHAAGVVSNFTGQEDIFLPSINNPLGLFLSWYMNVSVWTQ